MFCVFCSAIIDLKVNNMKLSITNSGLIREFGEENAIRIIAEAGFDAVDLDLTKLTSEDDVYRQADYKNHVMKIKQLGEQLGISYNQAHAIYPPQIQNQDEYNAKMFDVLVRTVDICHELGITTVALHPFRLEYGDEWKANIDLLQRLTPYIKGSGVKYGLENTFFYAPASYRSITEVSLGRVITKNEEIPRKRFTKIGSFSKELVAMLDELDRDCYCAILDTGHAKLVNEEPEDAVKILGKDLQGLHIHEVDGYKDTHTNPYDCAGSIDWKKTLKALKDINYNGDMTFETCFFGLRYPKELIPAVYKLMEQTGRYMLSQIKAL